MIDERSRLAKVQAVVFDVFGTLAEITVKSRAYAKLFRYFAVSGRLREAGDSARVMSSNVPFADLPTLFGVNVSPTILGAWEADLKTELSSIILRPDARECLTALRARGYKIGLCSNLTMPYAEPVIRLLPFELDAYGWSFEVGAVKPDPAIYQSVCTKLNCSPELVLMVGDTLLADHTGPRATGMLGYHLSRKAPSPVPESVKSLLDILPLLAGERELKAQMNDSGRHKP